MPRSYSLILCCILLFSCEKLDLKKATGICEDLSFSKTYTETINATEKTSDHVVFCPTSKNYLKATINFDQNNVYGSMRPDCDTDWNKTTGLTLPGSTNPHDNSARFVHRISGDFKHLELGYYVHRLGSVVVRDTSGIITGSEEVNDLVKGFIMDINPDQDYLVELIHNSNTIEFYVNGNLEKTVDIPEMPEGDYNYLYFYHGGDCSAPQEVKLDIIYHEK